MPFAGSKPYRLTGLPRARQRLGCLRLCFETLVDGKLEYALTLKIEGTGTLFPPAPPNHEFTEELICRLIRRSPDHKLLEIRFLTFDLARTPISEPFLGGRKTGPSRNACTQVYLLPKWVTRRLVDSSNFEKNALTNFSVRLYRTESFGQLYETRTVIAAIVSTSFSTRAG